MTLKKLCIVIFLIFFSSIIAINLTTTSSFALPKPYQDKINDAHKKKKEEKEKKKKEEQEKKKDEENKDEAKDDKDQSDPPKRYIVPITPKPDLTPRIKIVEFSLHGSSTGDSSRFRAGDRVDAKLKYRVTDYEGNDNVHILITAYDDFGAVVYENNITNPLRIGETVTEYFYNIIPQNTLKTNSSFKVVATIDVEGVRKTATAYAQIGNYNRWSQIRIHRVFLTSPDYLSFGYWDFPKTEFYTGDQYKLVVEYELERGADNDVEFDYKLTTQYNTVIDEGHFWDHARSGFQKAIRHGWFPYFMLGNYNTVRVEVKAYYGGSMDSESCYVQVRDKYDHNDSNFFYYDDYRYRPERCEFYLGPVYFANDSKSTKYKSFFAPEESIYLIFSYDYEQLPLHVRRNLGILNYTVYDPFGNDITSGKIRFFPRYRDFRRIKLFDGGKMAIGRYTVNLTLQIGNCTGNSHAYFYINNSQSEFDNFAKRKVAVESPNLIEYQIDKFLLLKIPSEWNASFNQESDNPALTFTPTSDTTGEVLIFYFNSPSTTIEDAISEYEKKERENSAISDYKESFKKVIDNQETIYRFYDGKISSKGKFFGEKTEDVKIAAIFGIKSDKETSRLYVIRIVAPWDKFDVLYDIASKFSEMIQFSDIVAGE